MAPTRLLSLTAIVLCLAGAPAAAQSTAPDEPGAGGKLGEALRELIDRMKPALDDLRETLEVFEKIDGLENYERPEILPNGDIIIRRRLDAPPWQPPVDDEAGVKT